MELQGFYPFWRLSTGKKETALQLSLMVREAGRRRRKRHIIRFPAEQENLFILLRLLSPTNPLRWASSGTPELREFSQDTSKTEKKKQTFRSAFSFLVREAGLEPARPQ